MSRAHPHVVSTRLTRKQLSALELVAGSRNTTISGVVHHAVVSLSAGESAKLDGLFRDLLTALGLDPDAATAQQIEDAMLPLIEAIALPEATDPLAASPDPKAMGERTFTTAHGVVRLSASEIESCEGAGAKLEAYAENKAIREAASRASPAALPDDRGFTSNPALAFPTTPAQQKQWVADRAARRAQRRR